MPVTVAEDPRTGGKRLVLQTTVRLDDGKTTPITVVFPSSYPHRPFTVYAPDLHLARHQAPSGNLCVFPRGDEHWHPDFSAADAVAVDVPRLVRLVMAGGEALLEHEAPQGEPFSVYYDTEVQGGIVLTDAVFDFVPSTGDGGEIDVAFRNDYLEWTRGNVDTPQGPQLRYGQGLLLAVRDQPAARLVADPPQAVRRYFGDQIHTGRWIFLDLPPLVETSDQFWDICTTAHPDLADWAHRTTGDQIVGVCFPEEISQGAYGLSWTFLVRQTTERAIVGKGARGGKSGNPQRRAEIARTESKWQHVRGLRWTEPNLSIRIPELSPLRDKTVCVVGLGSLGAPIALELAKQRVHRLNLIDGDFLDPGTAVRHPIGFHLAGLAKVAAVAETAHNHNPDVIIEGTLLRIGHSSLDAAPSNETEHDHVLKLLTGTDLMVSATAEHDVNRYLDSLAQDLDIPRLYAWSVSGYGGVVALLENQKTGCYHCLEAHLGSLASAGTPAVAVPPDWKTHSAVQGPGCADTTFTAAHADLQPISVQATRVANGRLCGPEGGYPAFDADLFTVQVREPDGTPIPPRWAAHTVPPNPGCPSCRPV